jgi:hypothetical protein
MHQNKISAKNHYGVLINTCDSFDDCWQPYFKLHAKYWPDCGGRLYLNTETKDFSYPGLDVTALKVGAGEDGRRLTWSECLLRALEKIEEDIVLYMHEDYFLKSPVKDDWVERYVQLMQDDESVHCIQLTDQAVMPADPSQYEGLWRVKLKQRYLVSCQAALWRKDVLKSYLRAHESAWQFEEFGSKRGVRMQHNFYVVDPSRVKLNEFEIIPYVFTGIVQGRWKEDVVQLFETHGIEIDYSFRGFLADAPPRTILVKLSTFKRRFPVMIRSYLDLILLLAKK